MRGSADICSKCHTSKEAAELAEFMHNRMRVHDGHPETDFFDAPKRHRATLMKTARDVLRRERS